MITQAISEQASTLQELLAGTCKVYTDPPRALKALAAAEPVAILVDPDISLDGYSQATLEFTVWLAAPGTDTDQARRFFDTALEALAAIGFDTARAEMMQAPARSYIAYRITYTTTYTL